MTQFVCRSCTSSMDVRLVEHGTDDMPLCKSCFKDLRQMMLDGTLVGLTTEEWQLLLAAAKEGGISYSEWPYEDLPDKDEIFEVMDKIIEQTHVQES